MTASAHFCVSADRALADANEIDAKRSKRQPMGRLAGLPIAVKDVLCERGQTTTCLADAGRFPPTV